MERAALGQPLFVDWFWLLDPINRATKCSEAKWSTCSSRFLLIQASQLFIRQPPVHKTFNRRLTLSLYLKAHTRINLSRCSFRTPGPEPSISSSIYTPNSIINVLINVHDFVYFFSRELFFSSLTLFFKTRPMGILRAYFRVLQHQFLLFSIKNSRCCERSCEK